MQVKTNRNGLFLISVFVAGILLGWLALGWGLFPLEWTNANLRDLRADRLDQYLSAVADAYAANADLNLAAGRLSEWTPAQAAARLDQLAARFAAEGKIAQAQNLQTLSATIGGGAAAPTPGATPQPAPAGGAGLMSVIGLIAGIIILGVGLGVIAWLIMTRLQGGRRTARMSQQLGDVARPEPFPTTASRGEPASVYLADDDEDDDFYAEDLEPAYEYNEDQPGQPAGPAPAEPPPAQGRVSARPVSQPPPVVAAPPPAAGRQPAAPAAPAGEPIGSFNAVYHQGDVDYDQSFVIEGQAAAGYRGECGMGVAEVLDNERTSATALEVWLFDKSDIRTVTGVLMSDYAFGDAGMRERLMEKGDLILVEPGKVFHIDAKTLHLEGRILELIYGEGPGPSRSVFSALRIQLNVYAKA